MASRLRPWQLSLVLVVLCFASLGLLVWYRSRPALAVADQLPYLPRSTDPVFYLDAAALRRAGLLRLLLGAKSTEEADYRAFVQATGFDFREDLDSVLVSFGEQGVYILATGSFDWRRLSTYALTSGGSCLAGLCSLKSTSRPDRFISFSRLRTGVMAIAVTRSAVGVQDFYARKGQVWPVPAEPVWLWLPAGRLKPAPDLPPGVSAYLSALEGAQSATLALGGSVVEFEIRLRAEGPDEAFARLASARLAQTTGTVVKLLARENRRPDPAGLSGVLAAGKFRAEGKLLHGAWPLSRPLLTGLME